MRFLVYVLLAGASFGAWFLLGKVVDSDTISLFVMVAIFVYLVSLDGRLRKLERIVNPN